MAARLTELEKGKPATRVYYLATAPQFYEPAVAHLGEAPPGGGNRGAHSAAGGRKAVRRRPGFGPRAERSGPSRFAEPQVYRIDHYLGKETVQNILVLRFANTIFEPIWNRNYIDHVQITVAEEVPVGRRGGYYERLGRAA